MGNRIYVGNLAFHSTEDSVRSAFAESGNVTDVQIVIDRETGRSRGFAFVTMGSDQEAAQAIAAMNGVLLDGRPLRVNEAAERSGGGGAGGRFGGAPRRAGGGAARGPRNRW